MVMAQIFVQRGRAGFFQQGLQMHVAAPAGGEMVAVGLAQRIDPRVAALVADPAALFGPAVEPLLMCLNRFCH